MNHLNEDKLIQYTFDLMEAQDRETAQQHLDKCDQCQAALKQVQTKFAAMDTLNADEIPTDELIARTLAHSKQQPEVQAQGYNSASAGIATNTSKPKQNIPLYRRRLVAWSAAAAAVALISFLFMQNLPEKQKESAPMWAKHPASETTSEPLAKQDFDTPQKPAMSFPDDRMGALSARSDEKSEVSYNSKVAVGTTLAGDVVRIVSADEIPDEPPFAPASAIELVVLPKPDKTQVTIYNSKDLTLVRDTRKLTLKPGWNWLQFMWANTQIDPTSLSLTPLEYVDKVDIELISYPARLKDIGRWLIRSEIEGAVPFEITYFASGLSWRAFYMGTMNEDETTMDLKGYVNVSNHSGQDFTNTQTRLIVGETRLTEEISYLAQRHYPYGPDIVDEESNIQNNLYFYNDNRRDGKDLLLGDMPVDGRLLGGGMGGGMGGFGGGVYYGIKEIEKTGLSEYFLYTIEGTENLTNQWTKRLPSFDDENIPVKSLYKYDDDRYGKEAVRFVSFANDSEHELGETPIPEGNIKFYRNLNKTQNLSYIGQSNIKYIPVNEDIELNLGPARLVKVEPVLIKQKTENYTFDNDGNIDGWDDIEHYKVTITNTRDIPIDIEITWNMGTDTWELNLESSPPAKGEYPEGGRGFDVDYKKHDKSRARFTMTVLPKSEKEFWHTIRKYRQKRIEVYVGKQIEQEKEK